MEDKCIACGTDVSDLSTQVCDTCSIKAEKILKQDDTNISIARKYCCKHWKRLFCKNNRRK